MLDLSLRVKNLLVLNPKSERRLMNYIPSENGQLNEN